MATQVPGDNRARAQGFGEAQGYDDERYKYGSGVGTTGEKELNRYGDLGAWGQNRQGVQMDTSQMGQSRGSQADALAMMRARANGRNLASDLQSRMNLQRAMQQQAALAGSARGPAGLAMAQQNAASNMANAAQGINAQAAYEAAREQAAAEQAYFGAGTGMRGQDFQQSYGQAQLNDAQRARNDAYQLEMERQRQRVAEAQLQANLAQQGNKAGTNTAAEAQNQETARQNAANEGRWAEKAMATVEKVGGGVMSMMSDERSKYMASPGETKDFFTPEQAAAFRDPAQASAFTNARGREGDWAMDYRNTGPGPLEPGVGAPNAQGLGDPAVGWTNRAFGDRPTVEGFAKSREGQPGAMFGEGGTAGPEMSAPGEMAPGTADYMHAMGGGPDLKGPSEAELTPLQRFAIGYNGGIGAGLQLRSGLRGAMAPPQGQHMASPAGTKQFLGPSSGPGEASSYAMTGGGLDTLGSIQKINDQQVQATTDPTGGMTGGPGAYGQQAQAAQLMGLNRAMSDERAKEKAFEDGRKVGQAQVANLAGHALVGAHPAHVASTKPLPGLEHLSSDPKALEHSDKVEAMKRQAASKLGYEKVPRVEQASAEPPQPAAKAPAMVEIAGKMYPADRINNPPPPQMVMVDGKMYPADKIASDERTKDPGMESYLDSTRPSVYKYKDQFQGMPGTQPGPQVGPPSAQDMAKTPVGSTMIEEDPETGMLAINKDKALKTTMSAVSYVNKKVNNLSRAMKKGGR